MWTVICMADGIDEAERIKRKLEAESFLVKIEKFSKEGEKTTYAINVPEFEADEVQEVLIELGLNY
ncbi:hypothetical protein [Dethiothermospora halolimnae]|uniref:hypothetical protein n=1 Tax=Dethiothermospora halolimnae TaxID=3114390 RepID=UPI003CCB76E7